MTVNTDIDILHVKWKDNNNIICLQLTFVSDM